MCLFTCSKNHSRTKKASSANTSWPQTDPKLHMSCSGMTYLNGKWISIIFTNWQKITWQYVWKIFITSVWYTLWRGQRRLWSTPSPPSHRSLSARRKAMEQMWQNPLGCQIRKGVTPTGGVLSCGQTVNKHGCSWYTKMIMPVFHPSC